MNDTRLSAILQVFTIILVFKGISATYLATGYGIRERLDIVNQYASFLRFISIPLLLSLVILSIPFFVKNISPVKKKWMDRIALMIMVLSLLAIFIFV